MNLVFACGGTAGHINPAIAVADAMRRRHPDCGVMFIGATGHMEEKLVPKAGYELKCLPGSGLSRKLNLQGLRTNLHAVHCVLDAVKECRKLFQEFRPDAVIGTGGYASFPALYAGYRMGIPVFVHESNAVPGVTTKLASYLSRKVLVCFEESKKYYPDQSRVEVVGMPIDERITALSREEAREQLGLGDEKLLVSAFGSLGARDMNRMIAEFLALEKEDGYPFRHIHATGSFGWEWMPDLVREKGVDLQAAEKVDMREYIYNMPVLLKAADVIISRAGASMCNEIAAAGLPCFLIPSPNVTNNHQEKNARLLENSGGARVILEKECSAGEVYAQVRNLMSDDAERSRMAAALKALSRADAADRICGIMEYVIGK